MVNKKITLKNEKLVIQLSDINCTSCSSVIENHFKKLKGIKVTINFVLKKAFFEYEKKYWNVSKVIKEMNKLGYKSIDWQIQESEINHHGHHDGNHDNWKESHNHESANHDQHIAKDHSNHFHKVKIRNLFEAVIALILLIPFLILMVDYNFFWLFANGYFQLSLASVIQFYFGRKFYLGSYTELIKHKWPGMNSLIAIGSLISYFFSIFLIIQNQNHHLLFEAGCSIIVIVLIGDLISDYVQSKAINGLENLMNLQNKDVLIIENNSEKLIKAEEIKINDVIVVRKGESIPTDGVLLSKNALINESLLTGESNLINKTIRQEVISGTVNMGESFNMKATKIGKDTILSNIIEAVQEVQSQKPKLQKIADRVASWFTPIILLITILVFLIHFFVFQQPTLFAVEIAISTLVIACPCALGIATPLAVAVGINKAAKLGIIYNKSEAFEKISKIDVICFDKTGTLTKEKFKVVNVEDPDNYLSLVLALEKYSTHPIAATFIDYGTNFKKNSDFEFQNIKEEIGVGISATFNQQKIIISNLNYFLENNFLISDKLIDFTNNNEKIGFGGVNIAFAIDNVVHSIFQLEHELQDEAAATIAKFQKQNIRIVLISGDNEKSTKLVADKLNINEYYAEVKPIEKAQIVAKLQNEGNKVAFVGDGTNDIVALQQSDLAIAMGKGSDIAKKNGDITIANNNINSVYQSIVLTKKTKQNIWMNFLWAFSYNLIFIPLAAVGLVFPAFAAIAMAFSDLFVVSNSLLFRLIKYKF